MSIFTLGQRAELLAHEDLHQLLLHLFNPADWPLNLPVFLDTMDDEVRELADQVLADYRSGGRDDDEFVLLASSLEQATRNVEAQPS